MAVIETKGLRKTFYPGVGKPPVDAVKGIDMRVEEHAVFGFLGPNGAGKTTTIKMLTGLITPTGGDATLFGKPLGEPGTHERLGFLPESPYFYDYLTSSELLDFVGQLFGMTSKARRKRADELLEIVGLTEAKNLQLRRYSKGMLQRAGIAQALMNDPELVILDEPMSGLDPIGRKEVRDLILRLREERKTVFFSTHILADVEMLCDQVAILRKGEVVALSSLEELLRMSNAYTEIAVSGLDSVKADRVRNAGAKAVVEVSGRFLLRVEQDTKVEAVLNAIRDAGGQVLRITPVARSLEEIFMDRVA